MEIESSLSDLRITYEQRSRFLSYLRDRTESVTVKSHPLKVMTCTYRVHRAVYHRRTSFVRWSGREYVDVTQTGAVHYHPEHFSCVVKSH